MNSTSTFDLDHFAVICMLFCITLPNFVQIGPPTAEIWRHNKFQDGGCQPCCICFGVMVDHTRSAFRGLNSVLKSLVRRINSSWHIAMYRFWRCGLWPFGLFTPLFGKFLGHIFPAWRHPSSWPPKGPYLGGNTSFEPFSVRISATVWPGGRIEKKQYNKKVTKVLYFPYLGGSLRWANSTLKLHGGGCPRRNHVGQVSNWNFHGLQFYSGSNFWVSHWF